MSHEYLLASTIMILSNLPLDNSDYGPEPPSIHTLTPTPYPAHTYNVHCNTPTNTSTTETLSHEYLGVGPSQVNLFMCEYDS